MHHPVASRARVLAVWAELRLDARRSGSGGGSGRMGYSMRGSSPYTRWRGVCAGRSGVQRAGWDGADVGVLRAGYPVIPHAQGRASLQCGDRQGLSASDGLCSCCRDCFGLSRCKTDAMVAYNVRYAVLLRFVVRSIQVTYVCPLRYIDSLLHMNRITYGSRYQCRSTFSRYLKRSFLYILRTRALSCHRQCALRPPWLSLILHLHKSVRSPLSPGTHLTHYANFYTAIDTIEQPVPLMAETWFECLQKIPHFHAKE